MNSTFLTANENERNHFNSVFSGVNSKSLISEFDDCAVVVQYEQTKNKLGRFLQNTEKSQQIQLDREKELLTKLRAKEAKIDKFEKNKRLDNKFKKAEIDQNNAVKAERK